MSVLDVQDLQVRFRTARGVVRAVDGLSFAVEAGETLAIVGESGCGKSATANALLRLLPDLRAEVRGRIQLAGMDLNTLDERAMRAVRGRDIAMVFQEPMTSLNPVFTVGWQLREALRQHQRLTRAEAQARGVEMLRLVGLSEPDRRMRSYPHQLSGGMRQRVMIAMALCCSPQLLVADEPTTALDVTIQAQILDLLDDLRRRVGAAIVLITHDLGVVAQVASRVVVMYAGRKVEEAPVRALLAAPLHPYTRGLIAAAPRVGSSGHAQQQRLSEIPGQVPSLLQDIPGCSFASRCAQATAVCREQRPAFTQQGAGHGVACHHVAVTQLVQAA